MNNTCAIVLIVLILTISNVFSQTESKNLSVAGLNEQVTIRRDERGIPHIEAGNEADLYFAQGYATAQDRLWQMDLYRRVTRGETAEIFGRMILEEDKRWRRFGFARIAEETVANMSAESRAILENYASGVNAYIATLDKKTLPVEFQMLGYSPRQWTPADSIVILKLFDDALSNTWRMDLMKASLMNLPKGKRDLIFDPSSPLDVL
ncbi:MAG: Penicillin acylase like protein, partial [Acidobacteria bacterium]|nr:Penicillin acylase like protein [Acidobacteriota bacterium]